MECAEIEMGSDYNCSDPLQGGAEPEVTLFNRDDILALAKDSVGRITGITLKTGASGYRFSGFGKSVNPSQEVIAAPSGQNLTKHMISLVIFDNSQEQKNNIRKLMLGSFVAMTRATQKNDNAFEYYGENNGLRLVPGTLMQKNENAGAYTVVLATPDGFGEASLPPNVFDTDYSTTLALVESFWYLPSIVNMTDITLSTAGGDSTVVTGTNFFGSGSADDVTSVDWVNQSTLAVTNQAANYTTNSATQITISSTVALAAGTYKLRITTSKGSTDSPMNIVVS